VERFDYERVARYAGHYLRRSHPWPVAAVVPFPLDPNTAVYMACDASGTCVNVGSVARTDSGLAARIYEHLCDPRKRRNWDHVWVLVLRDETPLAEVRRLEGVVGAHLGPTGNRWLPKPAPPAVS
jgi:hypothetical protein